MLELKPLDPKTNLPRPVSPAQSKQQRLMVVALTLLLVTLTLVLYRDRDFWFPNAPEAEDQLPQAGPVASAAPVNAAPSPAPAHKARVAARPRKIPALVAPPPEAAPPTEPVSVKRTVLPPLEVEVVAGANHRVVHPGTNSVRVELEQGSAPPPLAPEVTANEQGETAARVTATAADRVPVPAGTADVVIHSVQPDYPMLARQMKVQGSVILQALIARDGLIQDLRVLSGPPILATAAQEAVRQWHFKPHYDGGAAVETQAKITVNFTISTN